MEYCGYSIYIYIFDVLHNNTSSFLILKFHYINHSLCPTL